MTHPGHRTIAGLTAAVLMCVVLAGCGSSVIGRVLSINSVKALLDSDWSSESIIQILADVSGYTTLTRVIALVRKVGSSEEHEVELIRNAQGQFEGVFTPDESSSGAPAEYEITVKATDPAGTSDQSDPVTVEVPSSEPTTP